jgi:hypothetical protein
MHWQCPVSHNYLNDVPPELRTGGSARHGCIAIAACAARHVESLTARRGSEPDTTVQLLEAPYEVETAFARRTGALALATDLMGERP